jgi:hypothetical protein
MSHFVDKRAANCFYCAQSLYRAETVAALTAERDALREDAMRYRWLRSGDYSLPFARAVLNDTPVGIDKSIDDAIAAGGKT